MKIASIYPSEESEQAISNYTKQLIKNQKNQKINVKPIKYLAGKPFSLFKKFNEFKNYDVIHIQHEYNLLGWYGLPFFVFYFYMFFSKTKLITTMHTVLSRKEKFKSGKLKTFLRKILYWAQNRLIGRVSDKVVVHANFFKKILVKEYNVPPKKIIMFPQGVQEDIKLISQARAKKELKLKGPVYLVIGSFIPDHGADIAVRQSKKIGKTVLIVANSKALNDRNDSRIRDWLELNKNIVKKDKLEKYVRFDIRELPYPLWWKYFAASDIVLLPYKGNIGSGIFADCIATKKPMIGSNIKYFNEFAKDWGFIKIANTEGDFGKVVKEVMKKKNYNKMISEFKRYLKQFGLTPLAKKYAKLYNSLK